MDSLIIPYWAIGIYQWVWTLIHEFKNCISTHKYYQKVIDNENYAKKIGINATPSFLIFNNGELIRIIGAQQLEKFQNVIEQLTLR